MQVSDLGEFALIARLQRFLPEAAGPRIVRGIGDDCAVLSPSPGMELLWTTDTQEEGVHFRRDWSEPEEIGWRCLAVNVSDIAAMAGEPLGALVAMSLPSTIEVTFVDRLYEGLQAHAQAYGCPIIGGNITKSSERLSVTIAVLGEVPPGEAGYRSGAQVGDEIWVTGSLGGAKAGLQALLHSHQLDLASVPYPLSRYRRPCPRLAEARYLRQHDVLHSILDMSDGLSSDLTHICEASGVGAQLLAAAIPIHAEVCQVAQALRDEPIDYALHGGEDFELCLTSAPGQIEALKRDFEAKFPCGLVRVGTIQADTGVRLKFDAGSETVLAVRGYDHFRGV